MIMLAFMVIIGKVLLFRSEQEFPLVQCNTKSENFLTSSFKLNESVHIIWSISYGPYYSTSKVRGLAGFKTVQGIKNLVSDIDEPVDYSNVGIRFMKNSYDLSRKVTTFLSE